MPRTVKWHESFKVHQTEPLSPYHVKPTNKTTLKVVQTKNEWQPRNPETVPKPSLGAGPNHQPNLVRAYGPKAVSWGTKIGHQPRIIWAKTPKLSWAQKT